MIRVCGLCLLCSLAITNGFHEAQPTHRPQPVHVLRSQRSYLEKQREELYFSLQKIDHLKRDLNRVESETDLSKSRIAINRFEDEMATALAAFVPPIGLSTKKYVNSMRLYLQLPPSVRYAIVERLNLEAEAANYKSIPEIVARLYEEHTSASLSVLPSVSNKTAIKELPTGEHLNEILPDSTPSPTSEAKMTTEVESTFMAFFGYLSRHTKTSPKSAEISTVMKILKDEKFVSNGKHIEVPGAYVIQGIDRKVNAEKLLNCIDAKVPEDWDCSVSLIYDVLDNELEPFEKPGCAILVFKNDFSTEDSWLYFMCTLSALATSLQFSFSIFGKNHVFDISSIDDAIAPIESISQFLLPFFFILLLQEVGHVYMAKKGNFSTKFLFPTFLPFPQGLPLLGSLTRITSSPSNLTSLFDFAALGPLIGFIFSLSFMLSGIILTSSVDNQTFSAGVLPSVPVGVLKLSTFGGSVVDYFNGGNGFITGQENNSPVPLHPWYCGMIVSAVSLIPIGATAGGRMSVALVGRMGHAVVSGITWLVLLAASLTLDDDQGRVLTAALLVYSLVQNDMEIPCRNETDEVDTKRLVVSFSLWFFAALILVPM